MNSPGTGEFSAQIASNEEMFPFDDVIMYNEPLWHWEHSYLTFLEMTWHQPQTNTVTLMQLSEIQDTQ